MENKGMVELNMEDLAQVAGGVNRTVNTGTSDKAVIRKGPGKDYKQLTSLENGTVVDTINEKDLRWDEGFGRHFVEVWFTDKKGNRQRGWIASSLVGLRR